MKRQWFSLQLAKEKLEIVSSLCFGGWRWKVTQMSAGSGYPAVTPGTGLVSKWTQLTGQQYQWADLSAAHASRYFSNCVFFLLFFTLPQFIPGVLEAVEVWTVDFSGCPTDAESGDQWNKAIKSGQVLLYTTRFIKCYLFIHLSRLFSYTVRIYIYEK